MGAQHQLLSLARQAQGLSQAQLAKAMHVSQPKISDLEAGRVEMDERYCGLAAEALDVPVDFFRQSLPRHATDTTPFHHRKLQSVGASKLGQIHARLKLTQLQIEQILHDDNARADAVGFKPMEPEEYAGGAREIAQIVRLMWGMPTGPIGNLIELAESVGAIAMRCNFGGTRIDGLGRYVPGLPPMIFLDQDAPGDRDRMTLAHEIGHLIMHVGRVPSPECEVQATEFASELLLPTREIRRDLVMGVDLHRLVALKVKWGVSMQALIMRARDLDLITPAKQRSFFIELSSRGWRVNEPGRVEQEQPKALRAVLDAMRASGSSLEDLAAKARCSAKEFAATYYPDSRGFRLLA